MKRVARGLRLGAAALAMLGGGAPARGSDGGGAGAASAGETPDLRSILAPAVPRGMTRVHVTARPFLSVLGQGGGAIANLGVEHYFVGLPLRVSLDLSPLALAIEADGPGSVGHLRLGIAYAGEFVEFGVGAGSRIQNYGGNGLSVAGFLRLGTLDGLKLTLTYDDVLKRNRFTGVVGIGMSNTLVSLDVPIAARLRLFVEGGISADRWIYASTGLRHRLAGQGGAGTWIVSGSFGLAWVLDRPACVYPDTGWCMESAWAAGPTLGFGLERRF